MFLRKLKEVCYQAYPGSAMCVQNFDDSRSLAIRITYRISLRSSSLWEPRHPLLKVVIILVQQEGFLHSHVCFMLIYIVFLVDDRISPYGLREQGFWH